MDAVVVAAAEVVPECGLHVVVSGVRAISQSSSDRLVSLPLGAVINVSSVWAFTLMALTSCSHLYPYFRHHCSVFPLFRKRLICFDQDNWLFQNLLVNL